MEKEFVTYELALRMKLLGFNEPCFGYYNTTWSKQNELLFPQYAGELENWNEMTHLCSAPLFQQAFRWFREKYPEINPTYNLLSILFILDKTSQTENPMTYEECELACLEKLLSIVEEKQKEK